jgi:hypothetical protein
MQLMREAVRKEAPAFLDAVLESFTFDPDKLRNVASPETLDRIASNALGLRLGDSELAAELYAETRNQVIRSPERWHDVEATVLLTPWDGGPVTGPGAMFVATIRWEYRTTPANPTLRFACVSDPEQYRELIQDPTMTGTWYFDPSAELDVTSSEVFEVVQLSVNGRERPIRRSHRKHAQLCSVPLGDLGEQEQITISYTCRVLVQRHGHLLYLEVPKPTKKLQGALQPPRLRHPAGQHARLHRQRPAVTGARAADLRAIDIGVDRDRWMGVPAVRRRVRVGAGR